MPASLPEVLAQLLLRDIAEGSASAPPPGYRAVNLRGGTRLLVTDSPEGPCPWICQGFDGRPFWLADWGGEGSPKCAEGTRLRGAWFLLPDRSWLFLRPDAGDDPLWGASHLLEHRPTGSAPHDPPRLVGRFPALPLPRLPTLPPFDRPAALPLGAGEVLLNFFALLLALPQSLEPIPGPVYYRGPYPTPALFQALHRSFIPGPPDPAPQGTSPETPLLEVFTRDEWPLALTGTMAENPVPWLPAPWHPCQPVLRPGTHRLLLHLRETTADAWLDGHPFRHTDATPPALPAGARIWREGDIPGHYTGGMALLGHPWRIYFRLNLDGQRLDTRPEAQPEAHLEAAHLEALQPMAAPPPMHPLWVPVIFAWAASGAHPALARELRDLAGRVTPVWASLPYALATLSGDTPSGMSLLVQAGLGDQFRRLTGQGTGEGTGQGDVAEGNTSHGLAMRRRASRGLALRLVSDVLEGTAPLLRGQAQEALVQETQAPLPESAGGLTGEILGRRLKERLEEGAGVQTAERTRLQKALPALVAALVRGEALPD